MKYLIFLGHPAQYHFYKNAIVALREKGVKIRILIKTKDILEKLLIEDGFEYKNVEPFVRKKSRSFQLLIFARRFFVNLFQVISFRPDIVMGSEPILAQICRAVGITYIAVGEDDYAVVKKLADVLFPSSTYILSPTICDYSKFEEKKISFNGYMKLAYLHPNYFTPDLQTIASYIDTSMPYVIIRLVSLTAHHDKNVNGISVDMLDKMIYLFEKNGLRVFISSESALEAKYKSKELNMPSNLIHSCLSQADMLVCDSQSMAVEASMLGVPSVRINSFVGKISVLEELEHKYKLTFGVKPENNELVFEKLQEILSLKERKEIFSTRQKTMLAEKIDITAFLIWLISNVPSSFYKVKGRIIDIPFMIENNISK